MVMNGEEGLECDICVDGMRLEHVSEFNIWSVFWTNQVHTSQSVVERGRVGGGLQVHLGFWLVLGVYSLLVPVLMDGSQTVIWREQERCRIRGIHIDNLRCLLGMRKMGKVPNAWIRDLYGETKGVDEVIDEGVLRQFDHVERIKNDRIAKRVYVGVCWQSLSRLAVEEMD